MFRQERVLVIFFYVRKDDIYLGHRVSQALEAAQWIRFTSAAPDLTIYAGDLNTEPSDVPFLLLRDRSGLSDCWVGGGEGEGHTCNTSYNSYSDNTGGKRIDYILYKTGGQAGLRARTETCVLPLQHRIPASLSARLGRGREVSYSDHEAVQAVLRLETGGQQGASGDLGNYRDHSQQSQGTLTQAGVEISASFGCFKDLKVISLCLCYMRISEFWTLNQGFRNHRTSLAEDIQRQDCSQRADSCDAGPVLCHLHPAPAPTTLSHPRLRHVPPQSRSGSPWLLLSVHGDTVQQVAGTV